MAAHDSFHVFRRFSNLRIRLLLLAQDNLTLLEKKLDKIDRDEISPLFLACNRRDINMERRSVLTEIQDALVTYGEFAVP